MDYTVISNPFEKDLGGGINVSELRGSGGLMQRGNINSHIPHDMKMYPSQMEQMQPIEQQFNPPMPMIITCRDIFDHVEDCPICSGHYKREKFFYIIIGILVLLILYLMMNKKHH